MPVASRTPEGEPQRCPLCGTISVLEPCKPLGDAVCPACGILVVFRQRRGDWITRETLWKELGADSLDTVELVGNWKRSLMCKFPTMLPSTFKRSETPSTGSRNIVRSLTMRKTTTIFSQFDPTFSSRFQTT